ncbi:uncharacterized protein LOC133529637 isoform X2 [Cydia pomonella]|uniref:uncharacterized protein LOC133517147 n=2 Tax=Cydia pomonella TaxID=82600 RepID=UPI002ADE1D3E|nr:uncharacterized protein LOC133516346 isoform X2 [Cydia pomonella]XP_061706299.1 uncharacterized protein LOC133517147 [Cydia pomonella]XP_061711634.1 uncharacterized protein LOC133520941 isoform X3 [Cydia pomonella]XP_061718167.1 uncharacterized protein LOC133525795 [Cydia pomonella]XP_061719435.1 uncharacterized protein LOC133526727 isoform X2 [Cydia pomonella]XP_061723380.1 uncharacterized protein LOC133529637 isoform X2 [Cydia pomonella]
MDLKNLKKTRASFKSKLTIFKSYLEPLLSCHTLNNLQNHELNTRFIKIQDMYNDFDSVQTDIENLTEIPGDEHTERENFETSYFGALAAAQELLSRHTAAGAASAAPEDNLVTGSNVVTALTELQVRNKWRRDGGQLKLGEMVLVKDDRLPPSRWLLGRVTAVYPGNDGVSRVADVTTTTGTLRRAYNRLCPLPLTLDQDGPRGPAC